MGYFSSLSKSATSAALNISEWVLLTFGLGLLVGILGEYKKLPRFLIGPKELFEILVVIGVAGEFIGDGGIFLFSSQLQTIEEREISRLNTDRIQLEERIVWQGPRYIPLYAAPKLFTGRLKQFAGQHFK